MQLNYQTKVNGGILDNTTFLYINFNNALKSNLNKLEYMKSETDLYGYDLFDDILNVKSDNER